MLLVMVGYCLWGYVKLVRNIIEGSFCVYCQYIQDVNVYLISFDREILWFLKFYWKLWFFLGDFLYPFMPIQNPFASILMLESLVYSRKKLVKWGLYFLIAHLCSYQFILFKSTAVHSLCNFFNKKGDKYDKKEIEHHYFVYFRPVNRWCFFRLF